MAGHSDKSYERESSIIGLTAFEGPAGLGVTETGVAAACVR